MTRSRPRARPLTIVHTPAVIVAPDVLAAEPLGQKLSDLFSIKNRLEQYLSDPGVLRKDQATSWPKYIELFQLPRAEQLRWATLRLQDDIDACLRRVLSDESPQKVFKIPRNPRGRPIKGSTEKRRRDVAMAIEVLRLVERYGCTRAEAEGLVADAFGVTERTVQRATALWPWGAENDTRERRRLVEQYEWRLRSAGKL